MELDSWDRLKDGPFSEKALKEKLETKGYHVSRYVYSPGTFFPDHTHTVDKIDAVVAGKFKMTTPEGMAVLQKGDWLVVPKGTVHSAEVIGNDPVISLDAVKA